MAHREQMFVFDFLLIDRLTVNVTSGVVEVERNQSTDLCLIRAKLKILQVKRRQIRGLLLP